jgi:hypothetical protein
MLLPGTVGRTLGLHSVIVASLGARPASWAPCSYLARWVGWSRGRRAHAVAWDGAQWWIARLPDRLRQRVVAPVLPARLSGQSGTVWLAEFKPALDAPGHEHPGGSTPARRAVAAYPAAAAISAGPAPRRGPAPRPGPQLRRRADLHGPHQHTLEPVARQGAGLRSPLPAGAASTSGQAGHIRTAPVAAVGRARRGQPARPGAGQRGPLQRSVLAGAINCFNALGQPPW